MRASLLLTAVAALLPALPAAAAEGDDVQDVVFFSNTRPVAIRLHVRVDGEPYGAAWDAYVLSLFGYLDRNKDGVLGRDEGGRAPSGQQFQQMRQLGYTYGVGGAATFATFTELDQDEDEEVVFDEFLAYYRRTGAAGLQIQLAPGRAPVTDPLTEALVKMLDKDKDGKLSKDELAGAEKVLRPYDENDNELVSAAEVQSNALGGQYVFAGGGGMMARPGRPGEAGSFFLVTPDDSPNRLNQRLSLAQKILERYDKDKTTRVDRTEIGLDREVFKGLDTNKDNDLDAVELMKLLRRPPDIEAVVRLGKTGAREAPTDVVAPGGKPTPLASAVRQGTAGNLLVTLGDSQIDLRRTDAGSGAGTDQLAEQSARIRQTYILQLKMLDAKGKGYVDLEDLQKPQFRTIANLFHLSDADGDGKVTEDEVNGWFDVQAKAVGSYVSLAVAENGQGMFDILDGNRDGSLGHRELRTAWERLVTYDRDGDGGLARTEIPRQFQVTLGLGQSALFARQVAQGGGVMAPPVAVTSRGPVWFRKMDRNGDGDVSLREFLGTAEGFKKIDADNDGLVTLEEAERYDSGERKK
jgi:Ca2+-binding EF-hand superfamily protein